MSRRFGGAGIRRWLREPFAAPASGGAAPVTPETAATGLIEWLDPSATYVTETAGRVSSFVGRTTGYEFLQASGPAQPLWSATGVLGQPAMYFDGARFMESIDGLAELLDGSAANSVYAVVDRDTAAAQNAVLSLGEQSGGFTEYVIMRSASTSGNIEVNRAGTLTTGATAIGTSPEYVAWHYGSAACAFRVGGAAVAGGASATTPACDLTVLGARKVGSYAAYMTGWIAEIMIYDHVLTAGEIAALEGYITAKYVGI